ncbi:hypothetical protein EBS_0069 [endosymbiont of unidentified scaly snail isolate Monju]|nr:hypothetical protein EBS_0069 [endosymbiont of unidentified scaly snail isolate Monju]
MPAQTVSIPTSRSIHSVRRFLVSASVVMPALRAGDGSVPVSPGRHPGPASRRCAWPVRRAPGLPAGDVPVPGSSRPRHDDSIPASAASRPGAVPAARYPAVPPRATGARSRVRSRPDCVPGSAASRAGGRPAPRWRGVPGVVATVSGAAAVAPVPGPGQWRAPERPRFLLPRQDHHGGSAVRPGGSRPGGCADRRRAGGAGDRSPATAPRVVPAIPAGKGRSPGRPARVAWPVRRAARPPSRRRRPPATIRDRRGEWGWSPDDAGSPRPPATDPAGYAAWPVAGVPAGLAA